MFTGSALIAWITLCGVSLAFAGVPEKVKPVKNLIIMIPDGMSVGGTTLTRWVNGGEKPLAMDELACGLVRTYPSDAIINDSAPAGTAYACGITAQTGNIGVYPDVLTMPGLPQPKPNGVNNLSPAANIMEAARLQGRATGLVVTCEIQHATPADFAAHDPSRRNYDDLGEQTVYAGFDVVLGGGYEYFTPATRKDKEDMIATIKQRYEVVQDLAALKASKASRLWGLFAPTDMGYDLDRDPVKTPSLAEMTEKAIGVLSQSKKGFVLMVEGSLVDWAAHANDPAGMVGEINAFDKAVAVALSFAKKDKDTALVIVTDHGNSGLTIGNASTTASYDKLPMASVVHPLRLATRTAQGVADLIHQNPAHAEALVSQYYGVTPSPEDVAQIKAAKSLNEKRHCCTKLLAPKLAAEARIGFTTGGHTGEDVVFYAYHPAGHRPTGVIMNTDVARYMEKALEVDLNKTTERQFQRASAAFGQKGAFVRTDSTQPSNPVLVVQKNGQEIRFPQNKNVAFVQGQAVPLSGLVVYCGPQGHENWYVPEDAVALVK